MLTVAELRTIPLFAALPEPELERLAQAAADIRLDAGEFAVHEGGERALFAVLAARSRWSRRVDGIERTLGWRAAGHDLRRGADHARHAVSRAATAPPSRRA